MPRFHYWKRLLEEVRKKNDHNVWFCFSTLGPNIKKTKEKSTRYYLGSDYPDIYLSRREAECVTLLLRGYTVVSISDELGLSLRTVQCYTNSIKEKVGFKYIRDAVKRIKDTDFMLYFDGEERD